MGKASSKVRASGRRVGPNGPVLNVAQERIETPHRILIVFAAFDSMSNSSRCR
jgi:hypothetical protein